MTHDDTWQERGKAQTTRATSSRVRTGVVESEHKARTESMTQDDTR